MTDHGEGPAKSARVRKAGVVALAVALVGAAGYYIHYDRYGRYLKETNDAIIQADQITISSKLSGYVRSVAVADNQTVSRGALLVEIDPLDFRTRLRSAEAGIASALAAEGAAKASKEEAQAGVEQVRASLQAAQATLDFATREVVRYKPLVASGAEPASALSQLTANRDRAAAEVAAQQAALVQAERRVTSISAQTDQFAAQVESARVQRTSAANDLSATRLTAPSAGRVANSSVRVGQLVQPGMRLMTVVPTQDIYVVANFKETQVGLMRPGQPATITVDALPDVEFTGVVASVTPGTGANFSLIPPQNATGNFTKIVQRVPVRIRINAGPAARRVLVPGLSLLVEVDTRSGRDDLQAIRAEQERQAR